MAKRTAYLFRLGATVKMAASDENGEVIARAEYATQENHYLVRYRAGDGRQTECWWGESALASSK